MRFPRTCLVLLGALTTATAASIDDCPGYVASNIVQTSSGLAADLTLAGPGCNVYGYDLGELKLLVEYQTDTRLHVKIYDAAETVYQVPESVFPRPSSGGVSPDASALSFSYIAKPFSFGVERKGASGAIFDTTGVPLIFESQYLRLRNYFPSDIGAPNLYGLGEHTDPFKLNTTDYIRTLWSRDAYEIPPGTNLYGNHPVYFENRGNNQTHGVFLLNSNGMDIKINGSAAEGQYLEYNTIGGVIDLYFVAGPGPIDVAKQYAEIAGTPAMMPYWGLGFHQCRYGMRDVYEVADVVANYSAANIPLETMWTDIDYMDARKVFTLDEQRFPLHKVRELVDYLHDHDQHYIMMVDPAVAYQDYDAFNNGANQGIFLKLDNGSIYQGVVWPGVTAFPDWFNPATQSYWNGEFDDFFNADTGVDIDALWIDMNEASNFCTYPCSDPQGYARDNGFPPTPPPVRPDSPIPLPGWPSDFQPSSSGGISKRQVTNTTNNTNTSRTNSTNEQDASGSMHGLPNRDLLNPPYSIHNYAGSLSNKTLNTTLLHPTAQLYEYDTHNLYGTMMSSTSRSALLSRRPTLRPMVITRSTFAGAGRAVGHWLGDNAATWYDYRISIAEQLAFAFIYQIPMVGSDVCGYAENTTERLCARWAMLGAFSPFYRNHGEDVSIPHEFYRFPLVADAARNAISIRYRLLDYLYTAFHAQSLDGTPLLSPLWAYYPNDPQTYAIDTQFLFGPAILVSPVIDEDSTSVSIYLPDDLFYDFYAHAPVQGGGKIHTLTNVNFTSIPLHIRSGAVIPMRSASANTTTALRNQNVTLVVAPDKNNRASGSLYLDDGVSLVQSATSSINFAYNNGALSIDGSFGYTNSSGIGNIVILGLEKKPGNVRVNGANVGDGERRFDEGSGVLNVTRHIALDGASTIQLA
ncbi:hypothetical protein ACLMJK_004636 [Lecanora helva]